MKLKEHDVVEFIESFPHFNIKKGQIGTIVSIWPGEKVLVIEINNDVFDISAAAVIKYEGK